MIDVRRGVDLAAANDLVISAVHCAPEEIERWQQDLPSGRSVVAYCVHGRQVSQGVIAALRAAGVDAHYLEGGISSWIESKLPTRRRCDTADDKWVTCEHPKIDRIACPWLVSRFINPLAKFIYVPPTDVVETAKRVGGIPYDIKGAEFGHHGDHCSFDAIVKFYGIQDPALDHLATIVRGRRHLAT